MANIINNPPKYAGGGYNSNLNPQKRIEWIDLAKGIGMILVMLGHAKMPSYLGKFIYSFHMPLFFFLSGCVFSDKNIATGKFILKKFKSIIIPYIFFSAIYIAIDIIMEFLNKSLNFDFVLNELNLYFVVTREHAIWFLPCLFFVEVLFFFIYKVSRKNYIFICCVTVVLLTFGIMYKKFIGTNLPYNLNLVLIAFPFFALGYLLKKIKFYQERLAFNFSSLAIIIVLLIFNIITDYFNIKYFEPHYVGIWQNEYCNFILFYLSAFFGIFATITFSKVFENKFNAIKYIGRNSIIYLGFHQVFFFVCRSLIQKLNLPEYVNYLIWIVTIILTIIVLSFINKIIINSPFKFLIGKFDKAK